MSKVDEEYRTFWIEAEYVIAGWWIKALEVRDGA